MKKMVIISKFKLLKILQLSNYTKMAGISTVFYPFRGKLLFWEYTTIFVGRGVSDYV